MHPVFFQNVIAQGPLQQGVYHFPFVEPLLRRTENLLNSPFEKTLSLDVDLRLQAHKLGNLFTLLDRVEIAMVATELDNSKDRQLYGMPMFNNGMIAYKKTRKTLSLFEAMLQSYRNNVALNGTEEQKRLNASDQRAMAPHFSPAVNRFQLDYAILGDHWNWRGGNKGRTPAEPLIINHHPDLRNDTWGQLEMLENQIAKSGNKDLSDYIRQARIKILNAANRGKV